MVADDSIETHQLMSCGKKMSLRKKKKKKDVGKHLFTGSRKMTG